MCGIAGAFYRDGNRPAEVRLATMARSIAHRGPDGEGVLSLPYCGLAHRRLSIIDLSTSAGQPMTGANGRSHIVFNGEIYNFLELRRELEAHGHVFRTTGDTETILAGYLEWGEGVFARLDGMFAIALWDEANRQLFLARDRTGKKPLFVYEDESKVLFASEVKAILAHPEVDASLWPEAVPQFLSHGYVPTPASFWRRVRKVRPAHFEVLTVGNREFRAVEFWDFPRKPSNTAVEAPEAEEQVRTLFWAAVKKRLVSDVPLGAFLSGGIDSTLVVAAMASLVGKVKTFSIGFEGHPDWDETHYARLVANRYSTDHTEFKVRPEEFDLVEKLAWHYDEPFGDSSAIPTAIVSRLTKKHVSVALTGDGGDEIFAGYSRFAAAVAAERVPPALRAIGQVVARPGHWKTANSPIARAIRFAANASRPLPERLRSWVSIFTTPDLARLLTPEFARFAAPALLGERYQDYAGRAERLDPLNRILYINARTYLLDDLNVKVDRASMSVGLETRSPFLDTSLMEFAFGLPGDAKYKPGRLKWLLKRAMKQWLPTEVVERKKMGFGIPLGAWFRGSLSGQLKEHLLSDGARLHQFVRREALTELVDANEKKDLGLQLWSLLQLELWLKRANGASFPPLA